MKDNNMTAKTNRWSQNHQPDHGRIVQVSDGVMSYWTSLETGEDWEQAAKDFADGYDHGDVAGAVECYACLIVGGDETESAEFSFGETGAIIDFQRIL